MRAVPQDSVRLGSNVTRIEEDRRFTIHVDGQPPMRARAVILAVPAFAAAELLRPLDCDLAAACDIDPLSVDRDGRVRVPARCRPARSNRDRLRGAARRGHQHHGRRVDLVEVAASRARRPGAAARVSRRRARSRRAVENRCASWPTPRSRDLTTILRHSRSADADARVSLESLEPAAGSRTRRR